MFKKSLTNSIELSINKLKIGNNQINEISNDENLNEESENILWTQKAIKRYIRNKFKTFDFMASIQEIYDNSVSLPSNPSNKDRYIAQSTANGWTENYIYEWNELLSSWIEYAPSEGSITYNENTDSSLIYSGTQWQNFAVSINHGNLTGLENDDHSQYALLNGRMGDQIKIDSIDSYSGNNIIINDGIKVDHIYTNQQDRKVNINGVYLINGMLLGKYVGGVNWVKICSLEGTSRFILFQVTTALVGAKCSFHQYYVQVNSLNQFKANYDVLSLSGQAESPSIQIWEDDTGNIRSIYVKNDSSDDVSRVTILNIDGNTALNFTTLNTGASPSDGNYTTTLLKKFDPLDSSADLPDGDRQFGTLTLNTGLLLPTAGGIKATLDFYESNFNFNVNFTGPWASDIEVTITATRIGNIVVLYCPPVTGTSSSSNIIVSTNYLSTRYRPANNYDSRAIKIIDDGNVSWGLLRVDTNGKFWIYKDVQGSSFTGGGGVTGFERFHISYLA